MNQRYWCLSDIHGSYIPIENFWRRNEDNINFSPEIDTIILLGDTGCNFYQDKRDKKFKKKLSEYPFTYFLIRGNHEMRPSVCANMDPDQWEQSYSLGGPVWVEKKYPNMKYAMDYPQLYDICYGTQEIIYNPPINWKGEIKFLRYKTLVIPGAYSVDKYYRLAQGWTWFEDEQLTLEEMDLGRSIIEQTPAVDIILSHTAPIVYEPTDLFLKQVDQSMVDKTMERYLGEIEYKTDYKLFLWGHYHQHRVYPMHSNKQCIMLYNEKALNLTEQINMLPNISKTY